MIIKTLIKLLPESVLFRIRERFQKVGYSTDKGFVRSAVPHAPYTIYCIPFHRLVLK